MAKKTVAILVFVVGTALLVAGMFVPFAQAKGKFRVAIVLPGTITDESFCQSGYEGLKMIEERVSRF
ncbi:MAG: hypothetical protein JRJ29_12135 [Deltaproteobacteria bacterium]|nr:hypothetical protein [Deltaproteobacteria bacterium]